MSGIQSLLDFMREDWSDIWALTWEHGVMVVQVMIAATIFSVALGILVQGKTFGFLREPSLVIASVFLTIPSLALFTLFIPVFGIGKWPPRVALFMYAILPILRNTVTGLDSVDPAVEESAKGMGMSSADGSSRSGSLWRCRSSSPASASPPSSPAASPPSRPSSPAAASAT